MDRAVVFATTPATSGFRDGLGARRHITDPSGKNTLELLCLRSELSTVPSFEFALRERVSRLAAFRHPQFSPARSVERSSDIESTLALVSERVLQGVRLSDLLASAEQRRLVFDITAALCLIRQLVSAVGALHESARDVAHGAIGPERLVVTNDGQLMIVEYGLGAALEQLRYPRERYWTELRVALPSSAGLPRFDQRGDVTQIGVVALSLILGRPIRDEEYPARIADVVASACAVSPRGGLEPLSQSLRGWLGRALQLDGRTSFTTAADAAVELDKVLGEGQYVATPANLAAFLARYHGTGSDVTPYPPLPIATAVSSTPTPPRGTRALVSSGFDPDAMTPALGIPRPAFATLTPSRGTPIPTPLMASVGASAACADPVTPPRGTPPLASSRTPGPMPIPSPTLQFQSFADAVTEPTPVIERTPSRGMPRPLIPAAGLLSPARPLVPAPKPVASVENDYEETPERQWPKLAAAAVVLVALMTAAAFAGKREPMPAEAATTGTLSIQTNPSGAQASVDGRPRGVTPLTLELAAGPHKVELKGPAGSRIIPVTIAAGTRLAQYLELPQPDSGVPVAGWVVVTSPIELQLFENDRLLGSSRSDRIMVLAGRHDVDLVNQELGYRSTRTVEVAAGAVAPIAVEIPLGLIAVNASPWAEVWIDGTKAGETPIGNLSLPIGTHEVVFRHPDFSEERQAAVVTLKDVARLSVEFKKP
ncbi:MAG: hypothetical protein A3H97_18750 [Acidobacteria bacterium RIFCSPLOWO2_02_FULL_65_29]|nr:MAG: hypothetical protein A3H97_18750 [Acidobacteria bacterium RIFCSPLOWO2_02_FULL_65_29]